MTAPSTATTDLPLPALRCGWPALRHYLFLYALVAVGIDFGHIHLRHHSDTLLFTLAGQYALTPYFWEQDRVGLLIPALTSLCPDPFVALLVQTGLTIFLGLCAPLLLAEAVCPGPAARLAATLANAVTLAAAPDRILDIFLIETTYPTAIALGCGGLIVLTHGGDRPHLWRLLAAAVLLVLAHWVYAGAILLLLPLAVGIAVVRPGQPAAGWREWLLRLVRHVPGWASPVLLLSSFGVGLVFMYLVRKADPDLIPPTPQNSLPWPEWAASWIGYFETLNTLPAFWVWPAVACSLAAAGLLLGAATASFRRGTPGYPLAAAAAVLGLAGAAEFLFIGTRFWPAENGRQPRYILGFLETSQVILGLAAVLPVAGWTAGRGRWVAFVFAAGVLLATAFYRYGLPAADIPHADLDEHVGTLTADILAADVDAIGGDYWTVWPAVFHANLAGPKRDRPLIGITMRCGVFRSFWEQTYPEGMRVAVVDTEKDLNGFRWALGRYGLGPPVRIGTRGRLVIYRTRPPRLGTLPD